MKSISERLIFLRGEIARRPFAEQIGVTESTLRNYEQGTSSPNAETLEAICKKLRVAPEWLVMGTGPMNREVPPSEAQEGFVSAGICGCDVDLVMIPRVAARLAAGTGSLETEGDVVGMYAFRSDWIVRKGNTDRMVLMDVIGDSMTPEIKHGDMVLIDQSKTNILGYGYFAVGIDEAVYVKQLRPKPGKLILHSLNPDYDDIEVDMAAEQPQDVRIIGRVLWVGRELD